MNKKIKIFLVMFILCLIGFGNVFSVYAASDVISEDGIGDNLDAYNPNGPSNVDAISTKAGAILGIIQVIGSALAVIVLIIIGIKYMIGSVEEKAEYKKTFMLYVMGAILLFAGTLIPKLIYDLTTQAIN